MKSMICMCLVAMVAAVALARPDDKYTEEFDDINLDEILPNDRARTPYIQCALKKTTKCTPAAKELASRIEDALETDCSKCSEKQKEGTKKVIKYLINNQPEEWKELCDKYDPERKYTQKYEKELKEFQA